MGDNASIMERMSRAGDYGAMFQAVLNCLDFYNSGSPFQVIESGIGTFCDYTGKWIRQPYSFNAGNSSRHMLSTDCVTSAGTLRTVVGHPYRNMPARGDGEDMLAFVKRRVVWGEAVLRIGRPNRGDLFLECGNRSLVDVKNSWLGVKGNNFQVYKYTNTCSDGDKIILKPNWFDIAFYELSAKIQQAFIESNQALGRTEVPDYQVFLPIDIEKRKEAAVMAAKEKETAEQKAKQLLEAMETGKKRRRGSPAAQAVDVPTIPSEGSPATIAIPITRYEGPQVRQLIERAIEAGSVVQMPHGNATMRGDPDLMANTGFITAGNHIVIDSHGHINDDEIDEDENENELSGDTRPPLTHHDIEGVIESTGIIESEGTMIVASAEQIATPRNEAALRDIQQFFASHVIQAVRTRSPLVQMPPTNMGDDLPF